MTMNEMMMEQTLIGGPQKFYVDSTGKQLTSYSSPPDDWDFYDVPEGAIEVPIPPQVGDQIWNFETESWEPSRMLAVQGEEAWRTAEMDLIADQLLRIEDEDPTALPGTAKQWRDYRIKVRAWVEGAPLFPATASRPVRPS